MKLPTPDCHHGSPPPFTFVQEKMDTLFLGIFDVVPCSIRGFFSRESKRALCGKSKS